MNESRQTLFGSYDLAFMRRALDLSRKGRFSVSPNPRVGCVIVREPSASADGIFRVIGEGFHLRKGLPHAERVALDSCAEDPRGSTLFVTLEPCCHHGATPPCTEAILKAGIRRVVAATTDPFPQVAGQGIKWLRNHGVQVDVGLLEDEARFENRYFLHRHEIGLPWVILKAAVSLDGKLSTATGQSKWITGEEARTHVHSLRAEVDAILVGVGTVLTDDPLLTARPSVSEIHDWKPTIRVVLDPQGLISSSSRLLKTAKDSPVWIFLADSVSPSQKERIETAGARVDFVSCSDEKLDLIQILRRLAEANILSLLVEGGGNVHTSFLENQLVNEVAIYIAPVLVGGKPSPTFYMGQGVSTMKEAPRLERVNRRLLGPDTLIRGILKWKL
ncbi:MAG: bifunctional diaminohydroxyphosphoribosylaminopyrimidine deaminase/5-amino-6-(5-phosphoribosylamino)uracil reductase RibD [Candidatus Omnitrophota bacterium]|nr:MAG: bifunctional diaminohydroxyphosphoribosylaminopyrimidine deaminase/5-amino-6-(5-phosphoribosylamino)uracil reductase RibD [Candidatus Omnitrophota bacterium]